MTYAPRHSRVSPHCDADGIKVYDICAAGRYADQRLFTDRLTELKGRRDIDWGDTAAFAIFHRGASMHYLVLCWWGNDNELFTSVSVFQDGEWLEDPSRYSFCLYDMEIMWAERNFYIETMDCDKPDIVAYLRSHAECG